MTVFTRFNSSSCSRPVACYLRTHRRKKKVKPSFGSISWMPFGQTLYIFVHVVVIAWNVEPITHQKHVTKITFCYVCDLCHRTLCRRQFTQFNKRKTNYFYFSFTSVGKFLLRELVRAIQQHLHMAMRTTRHYCNKCRLLLIGYMHGQRWRCV